jgi:hypothetical protein
MNNISKVRKPKAPLISKKPKKQQITKKKTTKKKKGGSYTENDMKNLVDNKYIKDKNSNDILQDPFTLEGILQKNAILIDGRISDVNSLYSYLCTQDPTDHFDENNEDPLKECSFKDAWRVKLSTDDVLNVEKKYNQVNHTKYTTLKKACTRLERFIAEESEYLASQETYFSLIRLNNGKYYDIVKLDRYISRYQRNHSARNSNTFPPCPIGIDQKIPNPQRDSENNSPTITVVFGKYMNPNEQSDVRTVSPSLTQSLSSLLHYSRQLFDRCYTTAEQHDRIHNLLIRYHNGRNTNVPHII